ncbi:MAG: hypothetical protein IPH31_23055 [Lewinellaceae bacterium]|nr:hypothetical protein [Lewinellaceae bacterium]
MFKGIPPQLEDWAWFLFTKEIVFLREWFSLSFRFHRRRHSVAGRPALVVATAALTTTFDLRSSYGPARQLPPPPLATKVLLIYGPARFALALLPPLPC